MNDKAPRNPGRLSAEEAPAYDGHGHAAILLVESLIHGLIAKAVISVEEAIEILDIAADVAVQTNEGPADPSARPEKSPALLASIIASLKVDRKGKK